MVKSACLHKMVLGNRYVYLLLLFPFSCVLVHDAGGCPQRRELLKPFFSIVYFSVEVVESRYRRQSRVCRYLPWR